MKMKLNNLRINLKSMSKFIALLSFLISYQISFSQNFQWAHKIGGHWGDEGTDIVSDADGNVYTTGNFQGTIDFDPGVGESILASAGNTDVYITKFDAYGNFLWARSMGGASIFGDRGISIAIDANKNVFVSGSFFGTTDFDPGTNIYNLTSSGNEDVFIAKLDASGNFVWAKSIGGTQTDAIATIVIDKAGNLYATGSFSDVVDFNPSTDTFFVTSNGFNSIFILKLSSAGNFIWVKSFGEDYSQSVGELAMDASSNIYLCGSYYGTVDFNPGAATNSLTAISDDFFILKLDASGNFIWVKGIEGDNYGSASALAVDAAGNIHMTGCFFGTFDFDPGAAKQQLTSNGLDVFILKLNSSGNYVWARKVGNNGVDIGNGIALDQAGNVYTTGYFNNRVDFDPGAGVTNISSAGATDIFILKLNSAGLFDWAVRMGGKGYDKGTSVSVDISGDVYSTGDFEGKADFDPGTGNDTLESDNIDAFISKLSVSKTGVNADMNSSTLYVFPNPANDFVVITNSSFTNLKYTIIDAYGKEVLYGNLETRETKIDIHELNKGIYFVRLGEYDSKVLKFVKVE